MSSDLVVPLYLYISLRLHCNKRGIFVNLNSKVALAIEMELRLCI